jgi:hypothetical protein
MFENKEIFDYMLQLQLSKQNNFIQEIYNSTEYSLLYSSKFHKKLELYKDLITDYNYNSDVVNIYNTVQKSYSIISNFVFNYLKKTRPVVNNLDLYMVPIDPSDKYTIKLYHKGKNYLFTLNTLVILIKGKLMSMDKGTLKCYRCKNPYNNLPFTRSCILHFYFKYINTYKYLEDILISYYKHEFNEKNFFLYNEQSLRHWYIKSLLYTTQDFERSLLREYVDIIFYTYCKSKRIFVNIDFPLNDLLVIMRPYLYCFLITKYCLNSDLSLFADKYLMEAIPDFAEFNPYFGRKLINIKKNNKNKIILKDISFNTRHPECSINKIVSSNFIYKKTTEVTVSNLNSILGINTNNQNNESSEESESTSSDEINNNIINNYNYNEEIDDTYDD